MTTTHRMLIYGDGDTLDALIVRFWIKEPAFMQRYGWRFIRSLVRRDSPPYETDMWDYQSSFDAWTVLQDMRVTAMEMGLNYEYHVYNHDGETVREIETRGAQGWLRAPFTIKRLTGEEAWDTAATSAL